LEARRVLVAGALAVAGSVLLASLSSCICGGQLQFRFLAQGALKLIENGVILTRDPEKAIALPARKRLGARRQRTTSGAILRIFRAKSLRLWILALRFCVDCLRRILSERFAWNLFPFSAARSSSNEDIR
jgi:hypothetical protein